MARRSGAVQRRRAEKRKEAEAAVDPTTMIVANIIQDLKLIALKASLISKATRLMPFLYIGFAISLLIIPASVIPDLQSEKSLIRIPYVALFLVSVVASQIWGPVGRHTRREKHRADLLDVKARLQQSLQILGRDKFVYAMGIAAISKDGIEPTSNFQKVDMELVQALSEDGLFPLGKYRYLAVAISDGEGDVTKLTLNHRDLKEYPWYVEAKKRGISDEDIDALLNDAKQTTLVW